jgi:SAM-dependent methyltransferase
MFKSKHEIENYVEQFLGGEDNVGMTYLKVHSDRFFKSYELMKDYQNSSDKKVILDIGSNNGIFLPVIDVVFPLGEINTVDYGKRAYETLKVQSEDRVISFKKHYLNLEKDRLPFEDNSIDIIVFFEILEHFVFDPMHVLLEINRVLKPDGYFFISTPNLNSARSFLNMIKRDNPTLYTDYKPEDQIYMRHNRECSINDVKMLVENSGFVVKKFTTIIYPAKILQVRIFLFLMAILKVLGLSILSNDEMGTYIFVVCQKGKYLDASKLDHQTRFPQPIYHYV